MGFRRLWCMNSRDLEFSEFTYWGSRPRNPVSPTAWRNGSWSSLPCTGVCLPRTNFFQTIQIWSCQNRSFFRHPWIPWVLCRDWMMKKDSELSEDCLFSNRVYKFHPHSVFPRTGWNWYMEPFHAYSKSRKWPNKKHKFPSNNWLAKRDSRHRSLLWFLFNNQQQIRKLS